MLSDEEQLLNAVHELLETLFMFPVNSEESVFAWVYTDVGYKPMPMSDHDTERVLAIKRMVEDANNKLLSEYME